VTRLRIERANALAELAMVDNLAESSVLKIRALEHHAFRIRRMLVEVEAEITAERSNLVCGIDDLARTLGRFKVADLALLRACPIARFAEDLRHPCDIELKEFFDGVRCRLASAKGASEREPRS
jgi:hypothetical protein